MKNLNYEVLNGEKETNRMTTTQYSALASYSL